ncbi:hypothetical protein [Nakamurella deserti]|uniref:hypothetical protein n=1 Tax=Nakamurella deserti TaxID=2164074 RepID=UPI000DBE92D8|nr:hypothetical protein [Nakamurella deserti]
MSYERDDLRRAQDRDYAAEGIPMVLALVSEVDPIPDPHDSVTGEGASLAGDLDRYRAALAPSQRDGDLGVTGSVLQAVAYADFDPHRIRTGPDA